MAFRSPTHYVGEMMTLRNFYTLRSRNKGILQFDPLHFKSWRHSISLDTLLRNEDILQYYTQR